MKDAERLAALGFGGFIPIRHLRAFGLSAVPALPGVYVVLHPNNRSPRFRAVNPGGRFKSKDPTVSVERLEERWVSESQTVYIGKAGGPGAQATLRSRLHQFLDFGAGKPVGHWGGRLVWQIEDADDLIVCWRTVKDEDPANVEATMLAEFHREHGCLPFANLRR